MRTDIDISILTRDQAIGRVHGTLDFPVLPRIGERVTFALPSIQSEGFNGQLTVEHVVHAPGLDSRPMLLLSDVVASSRAQAEIIAKSFERSYELTFDPYLP